MSKRHYKSSTITKPRLSLNMVTVFILGDNWYPAIHPFLESGLLTETTQLKSRSHKPAFSTIYHKPPPLPYDNSPPPFIIPSRTHGSNSACLGARICGRLWVDSTMGCGAHCATGLLYIQRSLQTSLLPPTLNSTVKEVLGSYETCRLHLSPKAESNNLPLVWTLNLQLLISVVTQK